MDDSPSPSPPSRPRAETFTESSNSSGHSKQADKRPPTTTPTPVTPSGSATNDKHEYSKTNKPARSRSLNQKSSQSTSKIPGNSHQSSHSTGLKKKTTTVSTGQLVGGGRPATGTNGGVKHGDDPKRKLFSAKR